MLLQRWQPWTQSHLVYNCGSCQPCDYHTCSDEQQSTLWGDIAKLSRPDQPDQMYSFHSGTWTCWMGRYKIICWEAQDYGERKGADHDGLSLLMLMTPRSNEYLAECTNDSVNFSQHTPSYIVCIFHVIMSCLAHNNGTIFWPNKNINTQWLPQ